MPLPVDPRWSPRVEELAQALAKELGALHLMTLVRPIAEAQVALNRLNEVSQILLAQTLDQESASRARSGKRRLKLEDLLDPGDVEIFNDTPMKQRFVKKPLEKTLPLQLTLGEQGLQQVKQLCAIDRYERAALSRYRKAIRAFDAARRQSSPKELGREGQHAAKVD